MKAGGKEEDVLYGDSYALMDSHKVFSILWRQLSRQLTCPLSMVTAFVGPRLLFTLYSQRTSLCQRKLHHRHPVVALSSRTGSCPKICKYTVILYNDSITTNSVWLYFPSCELRHLFFQEKQALSICIHCQIKAWVCSLDTSTNWRPREETDKLVLNLILMGASRINCQTTEAKNDIKGEGKGGGGS